MTETVARATTRRRSVALSGRVDWSGVSAWLLAFVLVTYLALEGGGYDPIVRGEVGLAIWWIVLLGAAAGVLPAASLGRTAWVGGALLLAFVGWTALSLGWTESDERTVTEIGRGAVYVGALLLAMCAVARSGVRPVVNGVATAIALIAGLALLSRLESQLFPANDLAKFFGEAGQSKLSYPLNYWNGLAALLAMGLPLLLHAASSARTVAMQAAAAAAIPIVAGAAFLTASRGGAIAVALATLVWFLLTPDRLARLLTLGVAATGTAIVIASLDQRDALQSGLTDAAARAQGDDVLLLAIVVCAGVALVQVAVGLMVRYAKRPAWSIVPRSRARVIALVGGALAVLALAITVPTTLDRQWQEFKAVTPTGTTLEGEDAFARLQSASGNGRYMYWQQAADAQQTRPFGGIGAGTYEFWWARHRPAEYSGPFVRDAHSLYLDVFAELGIPGLILIVGFLGFVLAAGAFRALSTALPNESRGAIAAATGASVAFVVAAGLEWVWELPAVAVAFLVLAAAVLVGVPRPGRHPRLGRVALVGLAVVGLVIVAIPLAGTVGVRQSQAQVREGDLTAALKQARTSARIQPYSATAHLQEALILERAGDLPQATAAAGAATRDEPTNWRTWLVLSRLEARSGDAGASVAAYRKAKRLNPLSPIFTAR